MAQTPSIRQLNHSHHFSSTFCWAAHQPQRVGMDICRQICTRIQTCNLDTREGANNYMTDSYSFPWGTFRHGILPLVSSRALTTAAWTFWEYIPVSLCLRFWCRRGRLSFLSLIASVSRRWIRTETTWVSFRTLSNCSPLKAFSHFPFYAGFFSLFDYWLLPLSNFFRSTLWSFASSMSDHYDVLLKSSICNGSAVHFFFEKFLDHTKPMQCEAERNPAILTCKNLPGQFP